MAFVCHLTIYWREENAENIPGEKGGGALSLHNKCTTSNLTPTNQPTRPLREQKKRLGAGGVSGQPVRSINFRVSLT